MDSTNMTKIFVWLQALLKDELDQKLVTFEAKVDQLITRRGVE